MPIPGGFKVLYPSIPILVILTINGNTDVGVIVAAQSAVTKDPTEPDMFSIVGDITIAAAVTKKAILEINEECYCWFYIRYSLASANISYIGCCHD